jgi:hypothetical protein
MIVTLLHDTSILCSCHRACLLRRLAGPWQLHVQRPFDLADDLYNWDGLAVLELHHPHLYVNLSRKVLLLYLPGQQQPIEQNRQAEGVHRNHNALVNGIGINIV